MSISEPTTSTDQQSVESMKQAQKRLDYVAGLRQLADALEAAPTFPLPTSTTLNVWAQSLPDLLRIRAAMPVEWTSISDSHYLMFRRAFGGVIIDVNLSRDKFPSSPDEFFRTL